MDFYNGVKMAYKCMNDECRSYTPFRKMIWEKIYPYNGWNNMVNSFPDFHTKFLGLNDELNRNDNILELYRFDIVGKKIILRFRWIFYFDVIFNINDFVEYYLRKCDSLQSNNRILDYIAEYWYYEVKKLSKNQCPIRKRDVFDETVPYKYRIGILATMFLKYTAKERKKMNLNKIAEYQQNEIEEYKVRVKNAVEAIDNIFENVFKPRPIEDDYK